MQVENSLATDIGGLSKTKISGARELYIAVRDTRDEYRPPRAQPVREKPHPAQCFAVLMTSKRGGATILYLHHS